MNPKRITDMASAFYESSVLFAASDLGIFTTLAKQPGADANRVGELCGLDPRGTRLLLDACVALGLLRKEADSYHNSPESAAFLVPGGPGDLSRAIRYNRDVYAAWGKLPELVRTGRPVESPQLHYGDDPARTRAFVLAMHGRALGIGKMAIPHIDLDGCKKLLDVGGGPGTFAALLAESYPGLKCQVMDLPPNRRHCE